MRTIITIFIFLIICTTASYSAQTGTQNNTAITPADANSKPEKHKKFKIQYYKIYKQKPNRTDEFEQPLKPGEITKFLHFRVTKDKQNRIVHIAYYFKNLKIAPYVNDDKVWFHYVKFTYDKKNRLEKKVFYRTTGKPEAQYKFEWNEQGKIIKVDFMTYDINPYREKPFNTKYFLLYEYHPDGKLKKAARFDQYTNPEEKFIYDKNERLIRYERFLDNSKVLNYYITYQYAADGKVTAQTVYNIDGVMVEVPSTEERRKYQDLLRTRYPRPGRRGPIQDSVR